MAGRDVRIDGAAEFGRYGDSRLLRAAEEMAGRAEPGQTGGLVSCGPPQNFRLSRGRALSAAPGGFMSGGVYADLTPSLANRVRFGARASIEMACVDYRQTGEGGEAGIGLQRRIIQRVVPETSEMDSFRAPG